MPSPISRITFFAFFFDSDCFRGLGQVLLDAPCAAVFAEFATGLAVEQRRIVLARLGRQGAAEHGHGDGKRGRGDNLGS